MREREVSGLDASGDVTTHAIEDELVTKRKPRRSKKPALSDSNQIRNGKPPSSCGGAYEIHNTEESATKRIRTESESRYFERNMSADLQTPQKGRVVEDESDISSEDFVIENTTLVSIDSKYTVLTGSNTTGNDETNSMTSDSNTETSSVAHLRHWLDELGQKNKKHFEHHSSIGLVPSDANELTKHRAHKARTEVPPTPLPPTSVAGQRKLETPIARARSTPVRIKSRHSDVQATNEGYKSVAKLAAWLADDPTKNKKEILTLRRGANVIAKSRAFDKGLTNVIIEQHSIRSGSVLNRKSPS